MISRRASLLLAALATATPLGAQIPPQKSLPVTSVQRTFIEATIIVVQEANSLHTFSTYLKDWRTLQLTAPNSQFWAHDYHVVVQDGLALHGLGTRQGAYASVALTTPGPSYVSAPGPACLSAVIDGNRVHFFSSFTGSWSTVTLQGTPMASVDKLAAIVSDGNQTYACSAHYGQPVLLNAPGVTNVKSQGYCAYAESATEVHLFSATSNTWTTVPGGATTAVVPPTPRTAMIILEDLAMYRFWSAFTNDVVVAPRSGLETLTPGDHASVIIDGPTAYAFSSAAGRLVVQNFTNTPAIAASSAYHIILDDGSGGLHAFSGPRGAFAPVLQISANVNVESHAFSAAAAVQDTVTDDVDFYSAMTGRWYRAPRTPNGNIVMTYAGGVLLDPAGGLHGFAATYGTFTTLPGIVPSNIYQFGGNFCAQTGARLDVFNPQLPAWRTQVTSSAPTSVILHHGAVNAQAGSDVYFYGTYNDQWTHIALSSPPVAIGRSDECGYIDAGTEVYGIGGSGQTSNLAIFPEWWRLLTRRSRTDFFVIGEPGAPAAILLGATPADIPIPGIGTLLVDLATAAFIPLPSIPSSGSLSFPFHIPASPEFFGILVNAQSLILPPGAALPYLTNVYRSMIF